MKVLEHYLILTSFRGVTVKLIYDYGVFYIFHPYILETNSTNITRTSLYKGTPKSKKGKNKKEKKCSSSL